MFKVKVSMSLFLCVPIFVGFNYTIKQNNITKYMSVPRVNYKLKKWASLLFSFHPIKHLTTVLLELILNPYFKRGDIVHSKTFKNIPISEINLSAISMVNLHNTKTSHPLILPKLSQLHKNPFNFALFQTRK